MPDSRYRSLLDPDTLRGFVQNVREGIYITAADGEILDANPAFLSIFGVESLEELKRYRASDLLVDPEQRHRELDLLRSAGELREYELELQRPDGERRTVLDTCYLVEHPESGELLFHGILIDITPRKELEQRLKEMASRDPLTGCHNRRYLGELEHHLEEEVGDWGVIIFDVDHFKRYNDEHGHPAGDAALVRFAHFLRRFARGRDTVIRVGGDEFLLLLVGEDATATEEVAKRFEQELLSAPVSFSHGWAVRDENEPVRVTIRRADEALLAERGRRRGGQKA